MTFLSYTLGFLTDQTSVVSTTPSNSSCTSAGECLSYLLPGGLYRTNPNPANTTTKVNGGEIYIVESAPGYQVDFAYGPPNMFQWSDCHIFPVNETAIAFCLKTVNYDLFAG